MTYLWLLIGSLVVNLIFFLIAFRLKTDKFTDFTYGATFTILSLISLLVGGTSKLGYILFIMISLWAIRLALFLVIRIRKIKKDARFDQMRDSFVKFGTFWLLQAISVWIILLPSFYYFFSDLKIESSLIFVGIIIWGVGLIVESKADQQKFSFNNNANNKGKWIESGIWQYSRHPNYLGEMLVWIGIYIFTLSVMDYKSAIIFAIGPVWIITLLLFVSGIPKLEKSADAKWGSQKDYQNYKKRVPKLIPFIKF
jgi:steroid 5-alpha reductase family enzyme